MRPRSYNSLRQEEGEFFHGECVLRKRDTERTEVGVGRGQQSNRHGIYGNPGVSSMAGGSVRAISTGRGNNLQTVVVPWNGEKRSLGQ